MPGTGALCIVNHVLFKLFHYYLAILGVKNEYLFLVLYRIKRTFEADFIIGFYNKHYAAFIKLDRVASFLIEPLTIGDVNINDGIIPNKSFEHCQE